jgi:hypothetical protein
VDRLSHSLGHEEAELKRLRAEILASQERELRYRHALDLAKTALEGIPFMDSVSSQIRWVLERSPDTDLQAALWLMHEALEKCHEEIIGKIGHEGGDLRTALERADKALFAAKPLLKKLGVIHD